MKKETVVKNHNSPPVVIQHNNLIQNTSNNLTLRQSKILLFLISCISKNDQNMPNILIDYTTLLEITGERKSMHSKKRIEDFLKDLSGKVFYEFEGEMIKAFPWFMQVYINYNGKNMVLFTFNPILKDHLLQLKRNFTQYKLGYILDLSSTYSIKLYDIFSSYSFIGSMDISVDELRSLLNLKNEHEDIDKFPVYKELNRRVLSPCIADINAKTDLTIKYDPIGCLDDRRKVCRILFHIEKKEDVSPAHIIPEYFIEKNAAYSKLIGEVRKIKLT